MPIKFDSIKVGSEWERKDLAKLWGYKSFHAIARGVVTPVGQNVIILFVTEEKQESFIQYDDRLSSGTLKWEGEAGHANDQRIADSPETGDTIHVFYRKRHHQPFVYIGTATTKSHQNFSDRPSKFVFRVNH